MENVQVSTEAGMAQEETLARTEEAKREFTPLFALAKALDKPVVIYDLETTGFKTPTGIVEVGYMKFFPDGSIVEDSTLINPELPLEPEAVKVHGITAAQVKDQITFSDAADYLVNSVFVDSLVTGFNTDAYDNRVVVDNLKRYDQVEHAANFNDALAAGRLDWRLLWGDKQRNRSGNLGKVAEHFKVKPGQPHRVLGDILTTARVAAKMIETYGLDYVVNAAAHPEKLVLPASSKSTKPNDVVPEAIAIETPVPAPPPILCSASAGPAPQTELIDPTQFENRTGVWSTLVNKLVKKPKDGLVPLFGNQRQHPPEPASNSNLLQSTFYSAGIHPDLRAAITSVTHDPDGARATIKMGAALVYDVGGKITTANSDNDQVAWLIVEQAMAKGWPSLQLDGTPEFIFRCTVIAAQRGLPLANPDPELQALWTAHAGQVVERPVFVAVPEKFLPAKPQAAPIPEQPAKPQPVLKQPSEKMLSLADAISKAMKKDLPEAVKTDWEASKTYLNENRDVLDRQKAPVPVIGM